jgi:hypothetical protein
VLAETGNIMNTREMIETLAAKKLWTSPGGKTSHATLYSAIRREINEKGEGRSVREDAAREVLCQGRLSRLLRSTHSTPHVLRWGVFS